MVKNWVLSDVITLLQGLKHTDVSFLIHDLEIDLTVDDEVNVLAVFLKSKDLVSFLVNHLLHVVLDANKELMVVLVGVKIRYLLQQLDLELYPLIIVFECMLLNIMVCVGTVSPQLDEVILP